MKFNLISRYKNGLMKNENFKLTNGSIFILFVFIIFLITIIGSAVHIQEKTVKSVSTEFGYECINLLKQSDGIEKYLNRDIEDDIYGVHYRYKRWYIDEFNRDNQYSNYQRDFGLDKKCKELATLYVGLIKSNEFKDKLILIDTLKKLKSNTTSKIKRQRTVSSRTI